MSDSRYVVVETVTGERYVAPRTERLDPNIEVTVIPTYTLAEIIYKLPEYTEKYGSLGFSKDAPFYCFGFQKEIESYSEYPIEAAANLLLVCSENEDLWYVNDISDK